MSGTRGYRLKDASISDFIRFWRIPSKEARFTSVDAASDNEGMFAMLVSLTKSIVSDIKREVLRVFPAAHSSHLSEAIARGLGFETNAVLMSRVPDKGISAFASGGFGDTPRGRAAAIDDAALLGFLASKGLRAAAQVRAPSAVHMDSTQVAARERPLLQVVLRCRDTMMSCQPETHGERSLLMLADAARRAGAAAARGEMRTNGIIRMRAGTHGIDVTVLAPTPDRSAENELIGGFIAADLECLTRLSLRIGWSDDLYPSMRHGFMCNEAPVRYSHFESDGGSSVLVWETAATILDTHRNTHPTRATVRLTAELREHIRQVSARAADNAARVNAVRDLVLKGAEWEARDPHGDMDDKITRPYKEVSDDEGIFISGKTGSFGLSRFGLVVSPTPGKGFTARLEGSIRNLAEGDGPTTYVAMLRLLRGRCREARDKVLDDVKQGVVQTANGHIESIEQLSEACGGNIDRYTVLTPPAVRNLLVECAELSVVVERDLDTWLRSGGIPRGHRPKEDSHKVVMHGFSKTAFVSAVDGVEIPGISLDLAEDSASGARAAIRDGRPGFVNVVEDIQSAGGDIAKLLTALRRHRKVIARLNGIWFENGTCTMSLSMENFRYGQQLLIKMPHDEMLSMIEGMSRTASQSASKDGPLNFAMTSPGPHAPGDVMRIRVQESSGKSSRIMAASLIFAC